MRTESAFRDALRQTVARAFLLLALVGIGAVVAYSSRDQFRPYQVGSKAIRYDTRSDQVLDPSQRVTVMSAALEAGRGIAALRCQIPNESCIPRDALGKTGESFGRDPGDPSRTRCDTQLAVADVWDAFSIFCADRVTLKEPDITPLLGRAAGFFVEERRGEALVVNPQQALFPATRTEVCPESDCAPVDHAGVTVVNTSLLLSEPHSQRVTEFKVSIQGGTSGAFRRVVYSAPANEIVHDLAWLGGNRFVATTSEASGSSPGDLSVALKIGATDSPSIDTRKLEGFGVPVGVAYSSQRGRRRFYVADVADKVLRWSYVEPNESGVGQTRAFWTMRLDRPAPRLLHMVTAMAPWGGEIVFAGGPDGLYVFLPDEGVLLARYILGRPVEGISWGRPGELFLTAGRYLCVLVTRPVDIPSPAAIETPFPAPTPPAPKDAPKAGKEPAATPRPTGDPRNATDRRPVRARPRPKTPPTSCRCRTSG